MGGLSGLWPGKIARSPALLLSGQAVLFLKPAVDIVDRVSENIDEPVLFWLGSGGGLKRRDLGLPGPQLGFETAVRDLDQ